MAWCLDIEKAQFYPIVRGLKKIKTFIKRAIMSIACVNDLMAEVEAKTGYAVTVVNDENIKTNSTMISASKSLPRHIIKLNPKYERGANYLTALQCLMLLLKFGSGGKVFDFVIRDSQEPRAKSQEPRAKSQEPRAKSQEPREDLIFS